MSGARFWRPGSSVAPQASLPLSHSAPVELSAVGNNGRVTLPVLAARDSLLYSLEQKRTLILTAPTGSGKTTQLPQILASAGWAKPGGPSIAIALPRRVAVLASAARIVSERPTLSVGHVIRGACDTRPADSDIVVYETAALVDAARDDPLLSSFSVIVVDDAHERALHVDVLLALLRVVQRRRGDLRIVVAAAPPLDTAQLADFFGGERYAAAIHIEGPNTPFPVQILYAREPVSDYLGAASDAVKAVHADSAPGVASSSSVLVFVPTTDDTVTLCSMLAEWASSADINCPTVQAVPLHAHLLPSQQIAAVEREPPYHQSTSRSKSSYIMRVVVATSIAQSSLTIDGVTTVIDCGFDHLEVYSPNAQSRALAIVPASVVATNQRAARAGRTQPGTCLRLYTQHDFESRFPLETPPEIIRCDLSAALLALKATGVHDIASFSFLVPPTLDALAGATARLHALGAIGMNGALTADIGGRLATIPLPPHLGRALLAGEARGVGRQVAAVCAMIQVSQAVFLKSAPSSRDVFAVAEGDLITLFNVFRRYCSSKRSASWCKQHGINAVAMARAYKIRQILVKLLRGGNVDVRALAEDAALGMAARVCRALAKGLFANAAMVQPDGLTYQLALSGALAIIHPSSVLVGRSPRWVIAAEVVSTSRIFLRNVSFVQPAWLSSDVPSVFQHISAPVRFRRDAKRMRANG
jgi:HrpA-like RNA helicase